ncbi:MAG TPA: hypothetical protein VGA61_06235 [Anaerolineae bacterium]
MPAKEKTYRVENAVRMPARLRWPFVLGLLLAGMLSACHGAPFPTAAPFQSPPGTVVAAPATSPLAPVSVLPASPLTSPTAAPASVVVTPSGPLVASAFKPGDAALTAADMADLFDNSSYSLVQPYQAAGLRGAQVVFPSKTILHSSAFVEGFATQIEIYEQFPAAVRAYQAAMAEQKGRPIALSAGADEAKAFLITTKDLTDVPPDSADANNFAYTIVARKVNALVVISIRSPKSVMDARLQTALTTVMGRIPAGAH